MNDCDSNVLLQSQIVKEKKDIYLNVTQTTDFVLINQYYEYTIYVKNTSNSLIDDIKVFVLNQKAISINNDYPDDNTYVNIDNLKPGESRIFKLKARCTQSGYYNTTFVAYGSGTEIESKNTFITCGLIRYVPETYHKISIFNFDPYEEGYWLSSSDYNDQVTQLTKIQNRPWQEKQAYYNQFTNYQLDLYDQDTELKNKDNLPMTHLGRETYIYNEKERTPGDGLRNLVDHINKDSQLINLTLLRIGNNELETNLKQIQQRNMMDKFGLLRSEIYHALGVIPTFSYAVDGLFRWARGNDYVANHIYPPLNDYFWNTKKWAGHGYTIDEIYINHETDEFDRDLDIAFFKELKDAEDYVYDQMQLNKIKEFNTYDNENNLIKGYYYNIREVLDSEGIFFINIPYNEIPKNFFHLTNDELQPIIDRAKPYGLKPIVRYIFKNTFKNYMSIHGYPIREPHIEVNIPKTQKIIPRVYTINYQTKIKWIYSHIKDLIHTSIVKMKEVIQNNPISLDIDPTITPTPFLTSSYIRLYKKNVAFPIISVTNAEDVSFYRKESPTLRQLSNETLIFQPEKKISSYYDMLENDNTHIKFDNIKLDYEWDTVYDDNELQKAHFIIEDANINGNIVAKLIISDTSEPLPNTEISYSVNNGSSQTIYTDEDGFIIINILNDIGDTRILNNTSITFTLNDNIHCKADTTLYLTNAHNICTYYYKFNDLHENIEKSFVFKDNINNKYHIFSAEYLRNEAKYIFSYKIWKNSSVKTIKAFSNDKDKTKGMACEIYPLEYDNIMIIFYLYKGDQLHYLTHITVNNLSDCYTIIRNTGAINSKIEFDLSKTLFYSSGINNDSHLIYNVPQYQKMLSTDDYEYTEQFSQNSLSWNKLYRINEEVESYAYIKSQQNNQAINDIQLYIPDCEIPDMSTVKGIYIKTLMSGPNTINVSYATNINHSCDSKAHGFILNPSNINFYYNMSSNYIDYLMKIDTLNDDKESLDIHQKMFDEMQRFSNNLKKNVYDDKTIIDGRYWTELTFNNEFDIPLSDVSSINLVLEGYNNNSDITVDSELCTLLNGYGISTTKIYSGYFYEKIPLNIDSKGILNDFFVRFRFNTLKDVQLFNYKLEINFITNQHQNIIQITDDIQQQYRIKPDDYQRIKLNQQDILGIFLNNGLIINLKFNDLNKGEIIKIYAINIEIEYQDNDSTLVTPRILTGPLVLSGDKNGGYLGGMFYDEKPSTSQRLYSEFYDNRHYKGFKIKDKVYQSFIANNPDITSINVMPNGYIGQPDQNMKISLYDDANGLPNNCLKTIYVDGWRDKFNDSKTINYAFNINNLEINHRYWFCFEQKDKSFNGYYYLKSSPDDFDDFKILYEQNDNLIDANTSLWFEVLSSDHVESFNSFSACQMDPNIDKPYIILKINNTIGEISNLIIRS